MPLRLEPVDVQHSSQQALLHGPLVLFAVADAQPSFEKAELLRGEAGRHDSGDCSATSADGKERRHAAVHEDQGGELQHVRAGEGVTQARSVTDCGRPSN